MPLLHKMNEVIPMSYAQIAAILALIETIS